MTGASRALPLEAADLIWTCFGGDAFTFDSKGLGTDLAGVCRITVDLGEGVTGSCLLVEYRGDAEVTFPVSALRSNDNLFNRYLKKWSKYDACPCFIRLN